MKYNTKQKNAILEAFQENVGKQLSIEDLKIIFKKKNLEISQATIYRAIDSLVNENIISKYLVDNTNLYEYKKNNCDEHYHLICSKCKKLIHIDCDEINNLVSHLEKEHDFKVSKSEVIFYGTCKECSEK